MGYFKLIRLTPRILDKSGKWKRLKIRQLFNQRADQVNILVLCYKVNRRFKLAWISLISETSDMACTIIVSVQGKRSDLKKIKAIITEEKLAINPDARVILIHQSSRIGLLKHWNQTACFGFSINPSAPYFVWVSDHDLYSNGAIKACISKLSKHPSALAAIPTVMIEDEFGRLTKVPVRPRFLESTNLYERNLGPYGPGFMMNGVFRREVFMMVGCLPSIVFPDKLWIRKLALFGEILFANEIEQAIWVRFYPSSSINGETEKFLDQLNKLFSPLSLARVINALIPWQVIHMWLFRRFSIKSKAEKEMINEAVSLYSRELKKMERSKQWRA